MHLANGIIRHPLITVVAWAAVTAGGFGLAVFGVTGEGLFDRVNSGAPQATDSDSATADALIEAGATESQSVTMAVSGLDLADTAAVGIIGSELADVRSELSKIDGIATNPGENAYPLVIDPLNPSFCGDPELAPTSPKAAQCALANPLVRGLVAKDQDGFLLTVDIAKDLTEEEEDRAVTAVVSRLHQAAEELPKAVDGVKVLVGGEHLILTEIIDDMKHDLELGEFISLPVALIVMVLVFAGFLAAAMPVVGALASILTCMGVVFGFTYVTDIHTSVINVISLVGVGLSIDYGLLVVSRFREEVRRLGADDLQDHAQVKTAVAGGVRATVTTAGRTVFYSALTIAVCVAGLMAFDASILRTFGLAGLIVVLLALGTATTLVPGLLMLAGHRLIRPSWLSRVPVLSFLYARASDVSPDTGVFSKLAGAVQKRPWWVMGGVVAVLILLALPIRDLELRNSTVELLPSSSPQRAFLDELEDNYPLSGVDSIQVISTGSLPDTEKFAQDKLDSIKGTELEKADAGAAGGQTEGSAAIQRDGYVEVVLAVTAEDPEGPEARAAVKKIRSLAPQDFEIHVTGPAARLADFEDKLAKGGPVALGIVVAAAFILLFLFTGSILIPLKALITNGLSLLACLGLVTWIFQGGHLGSVLGFTAVNGIESYILVLLLIFGFGLAMDYEVFLISRIKESWDSNHDPQLSVSEGLQHSGRIITSAALIIVMVFLGFAAGRLVIIKEIGLGLALAVFLDATLVRMLLVPATMSILGKWNWWAPGPLARLHDRLSLKH
ncbi:MAG: MMPL family transporter [Bifidobacteriaceae bacterium]|jgi:RND superfamily putative drug exporter|nr:MMPL family transporter [Bifidobacteriaceae bacterium]